MLLLLTAGPCFASFDAGQVCDAAATTAAQETGVPLDVLRAIARVETGRDRGDGLTPWPWTVNHAGDGSFFDTAAEAVAYADAALTEGDDRLDIGCFQINIRWHAHFFPSLDVMMDPVANALHAARYLMQLYRESGDWADAVAAYHSRDTDRATAYLRKFETAYAALAAASPPEPAPVVKVNQFPLLLAGAPGGAGSLVPRRAAGAALIGVAP